MADTVAKKTIFDSPNRLIVQLTNLSDGTGESGVIKVNKSDFTGPNGSEPTHLAIEKIEYDIENMRVLLEWDHTSNETITVLQGNGEIDYWCNGQHQRLVDTESGSTGDILLTTNGHDAGDGYYIKLHLRKKD